MNKKSLSSCFLLTILACSMCLSFYAVRVKAPDGIRMQPPGFDFGTVYANCRVDASCSVLNGNLTNVTSFPDWVAIDDVNLLHDWFSFHVNTQSVGGFSGVIKVGTDGGEFDVWVNFTVRDAPAPKLSMLVHSSPFDQYSTDDPLMMGVMTGIMEAAFVNVSYSFDFLPPENYDLVLVAEEGLDGLTDGQVGMLRGHVRNGGCLIVCADDAYCGSNEKANRIINDFGLNMKTGNYGQDTVAEDFASHPITVGVSSAYFVRPAPIEIVSSPNVTNTILARPSGVPASEGVLAISECNGKLIVLDSAFWWGNFLFDGQAYDNSRLFLNMLDYAKRNVALLWRNSMSVNDVVLSKDEDHIAVANDTGVYFFASNDRNPKWWFSETDPTEDFLSVAISRNGECVVAGQNSGYLYYFSDSTTSEGERVSPTWKSKNLYGPVERNTLAISDTGEFVTVGGTGVSVYYFADCLVRTGLSENPTWFDTLGVLDIQCVRISPAGNLVAAAGTRWPSGGFVAFYKNANIAPYPTDPAWQARESLENTVTDLAMSDDGYAVVAVTVNASSLHYWADATRLTGDPNSTWKNENNFLSVAMSYDGNRVLGGGVNFTSVHFWANARTRSGPQTEDWVTLCSLHVLDVALSQSGSLMAAAGMADSDKHQVYFLKSDGSIIGSFDLGHFSPVVAMSGDGHLAAVGGPSSDSLHVFELRVPTPVHNLNTGLHYFGIQDAVDAVETVDGHTISIDPGTYYEHVVATKALTLSGADAETVIIDGNGTGNVIKMTTNSASLMSLTVQNGGSEHPSCGLWVTGSEFVKVMYCTVRNCYYGIRIDGAEGGAVHDNFVANNSRYGIILIGCEGMAVYDNEVYNCTDGIYIGSCSGNAIYGNQLFMHSESGLWLYNSRDNNVYENNASDNWDCGIVLSSDSDDNTVHRNTVSHNANGLYLYKSENNVVNDTHSFDNVFGMFLWGSGNNTLRNNTMEGNTYNFGIAADTSADLDNSLDTSNTLDGKSLYYLRGSENTVIDGSANAGAVYLINCLNVTVKDLTLVGNGHGVFMWDAEKCRVENVSFFWNARAMLLNNSRENMVFHCNFIGNNEEAYVQNSTGVWDNGVEGNYWSDYYGTDDDNDGICDTPYSIPEGTNDNFPLMGIFHSYQTVDGVVEIISNSTVDEIEYEKTNSTLRLHVTNMTDTQAYGFCRITIPHSAVAPPYHVIINDNPVAHTTLLENDAASTIYFNYQHSTVEIEIIPEFPQIAVIISLAVASLLVAVYSKKRRP